MKRKKIGIITICVLLFLGADDFYCYKEWTKKR